MTQTDFIDEAPTAPSLRSRFRFAHLDAPTAIESATVAYGKLTLANFDGLVGWAWCSPEDVFSRKKGRTIATGRLWCNRAKCAPVEVTNDRAWFWRAAIATMDRYPQRLPAWLDDELFRDHAEVMIARHEEREAAQ